MNKRTISGIVKLWRLARGLSAGELAKMQSAPESIAIAGAAPARQALVQRLLGSGAPSAEYESLKSARLSGEEVVLDADSPAIQSVAGLNNALDNLARMHPGLRISLASRYPLMRPIVAEQLTRETSRKNAKIAAISALPGILPLTDWLLPATAVGDMLVLTRNQINLLLEISACYGLEPDPRARLTELIPIIGGGFGWRMVARELVGLVPAGIGVGVKAAVAYAGTYAVGKAATAFYATGKNVDVRKLFRTTLEGPLARGVGRLRRLSGR